MTTVNPEALLISSILRGKNFPVAISAGIDQTYFHSYYEEWDWLVRYYQKYKKPPTVLAFKVKFRDFIIEPVNDTEHFADEVTRTHARFQLTTVLRDVADDIADGDIDGAISKMHHKIVGIAASVGQQMNDHNILTDFDTAYDDIASRVERVRTGGSSGIPTGFKSFDKATGGLQPSHSGIVAARLGEGKSWALIRMATSALMAGYTVQYHALEMSSVEVAMRVHTFLSSTVGKETFNNIALAQGHGFDLEKYRRFLHQLKRELSGKFFVADASRGPVSPAQIAAQIERNKPDVVFIDYMTLLKVTGDGDWKSISRLSGEIKALSTQYQIPVVSAAQLNREHGLGKEPAGPEALAQSDSIGQDADWVITMKKQSASVSRMMLAKNRHGESGNKWFCQFQPTNGTFRECSYDSAMTLIDKDKDREDAK